MPSRLGDPTKSEKAIQVPTAIPKRPIDPDGAPTHVRGRWLAAILIGAWPVATLAALAAVALGAPTGITIASGFAVALVIDFVLIVLAFAVDDGDIDDRAHGL
jgi:hypothetical protein